MNKRFIANLLLVASAFLWGANYVIAKGLMPDHFTPRQIIFMRVLFAAIVFWFIERIWVREKTPARDLWRFALCAFFGIVLNQVLFFEGLNLTTPVNASIIHTSNPVLIMMISMVFLRENPSMRRLAGIILGISGALLLILYGTKASLDSSLALGNLLVFINIFSYSIYIIMVKPLMTRYHPLTVMKWIFFFGFILVTPICACTMADIDIQSPTARAWWSLAYVMAGPTVLAYLFVTTALKYLHAVTVTFYVYMQPLIAGILSVIVYNETIVPVKIIAALLVFSGIYFVNEKGRIGHPENGKASSDDVANSRGDTRNERPQPS